MPRTKLVFVPLAPNEAGEVGHTPMEISVQCLHCVHFKPELYLACTAFLDGIPRKILGGGHDHRKPFSGDDGIRYMRNPNLAEVNENADG